MDSLESDNMYAVVKSFEEGEIIENNAEVLEEELRLQQEGDPSGNPKILDDFEDDLSDMDVDEYPDNPIGSQPVKNTPNSESNVSLNCVQKVSITNIMHSGSNVDVSQNRYTKLLSTSLQVQNAASECEILSEH